MCRGRLIPVCLLIVALGWDSDLVPFASAQTSQPTNKNDTGRTTVEGLALEDLKGLESEMRPAIERYTVDRGSLARSFPVLLSSTRRTRFREFYTNWLEAIQRLDFESMSFTGKVDYVLFKNHLEYRSNWRFYDRR